MQARQHAKELSASQVPIILWAFAVLRYNPTVAVLSALDHRIEQHSSAMTAQVSHPVDNNSSHFFTPRPRNNDCTPARRQASSDLSYVSYAITSLHHMRLMMHDPCRPAAIRLPPHLAFEDIWRVLTVHCLQGVSLVLSSYQQWRYHPEGGSLAALAASMRQRVAAFKNSELATCVEAFSALGFHPGNDLVQVHPLPSTSLGLHALYTTPAISLPVLRPPELRWAEQASAYKLLLCVRDRSCPCTKI